MKSYLFFIVLASFWAISCQELLFNDDEITREIMLKDFHYLEVNGIFNIVLIQDSTNRLVIKGGNNISTIDALIKRDSLIIDDHKKLSLNHAKNTLTLHFTDLDYIKFNDPVNVSNQDTLKTEVLTVVAVGGIAEVRMVIDCNIFELINHANTLGYFNFIGHANNCSISNRYGSAVFADSLFCKNADINNESIGAVSVSASDNIEATIRGSGNIYYHGTPVIKINELTGKGRVIRLD
jgi:hypothetical protein